MFFQDAIRLLSPHLIYSTISLTNTIHISLNQGVEITVTSLDIIHSNSLLRFLLSILITLDYAYLRILVLMKESFCLEKQRRLHGTGS
jgi:hypothetical protein